MIGQRRTYDPIKAVFLDDISSMIIQSIMIFALGVLIATLLAIAIAPMIWARSSNVTRKQLLATLPLTEYEIRASRDHLRAEHAIKAHRLESKLEQAEQAKARQLIDINRRELQIHELNNKVVDLKQELAEKTSQNVVLMQNIDRKVPHLEDRSNRLMTVLIEREREIAALKRHGSYGVVDEDGEERDISDYYHSHDEIEQMREELGEEVAISSGPRRTIIESAEIVHEENRELLSRLAKLQARLIELESRETNETALLRSEMQNIAMALMEDNETLYRSHFHNLHTTVKAAEDPQNQLPFEFEFDEKKPVFIEKAEQAAAERAQNPTGDDGEVEEASLTARLETLLKQK